MGWRTLDLYSQKFVFRGSLSLVQFMGNCLGMHNIIRTLLESADNGSKCNKSALDDFEKIMPIRRIGQM